MNSFLKNKQNIGMLLTLVGASLWGLSGNCGQYLFKNYEGLTSNWLVPIRLFFSGFFLLIITFFMHGSKIFNILKNKKDLSKLLIYSILGITSCQYSYFTAVQHSNAGIATVLQYLGPALVLIYISFENRIFPKKLEIISLFISLIGIFLLSTHGSLDSLVISKKALFWGLFSALTLLINTVQPVPLLKKYDAPIIMGWAMFIGGIFTSLILKPWNSGVVIDFTGYMLLFVIIFFGTIIAFVFYLIGIKYVGPTKASLLSCIEPVSAVFFSYVWMKTNFFPIDFLGIGMIIVSVLMSSILINNPKKDLSQN